MVIEKLKAVLQFALKDITVPKVLIVGTFLFLSALLSYRILLWKIKDHEKAKSLWRSWCFIFTFGTIVVVDHFVDLQAAFIVGSILVCIRYIVSDSFSGASSPKGKQP